MVGGGGVWGLDSIHGPDNMCSIQLCPQLSSQSEGYVTGTTGNPIPHGPALNTSKQITIKDCSLDRGINHLSLNANCSTTSLVNKSLVCSAFQNNCEG